MHDMGLLKSNFKASFCNLTENMDSKKSQLHFVIYMSRNMKLNRFKNYMLYILHNLIMFDNTNKKLFLIHSSKSEYLEKCLINNYICKNP